MIVYVRDYKNQFFPWTPPRIKNPWQPPLWAPICYWAATENGWHSECQLPIWRFQVGPTTLPQLAMWKTGGSSHPDSWTPSRRRVQDFGPLATWYSLERWKAWTRSFRKLWWCRDMCKGRSWSHYKSQSHVGNADLGRKPDQTMKPDVLPRKATAAQNHPNGGSINGDRARWFSRKIQTMD